MKVALICPTNRLYMPYVKSYEQMLEACQIDYVLITWDRLQLEEPSDTCFQDQKKGHRRHYFQYMKYKAFVLAHLKKVHYDKVIVFGLQLMYFLKEFLLEKYRHRFLLDIRDYHAVYKIMDFTKITARAHSIVLASAGYKQWLPYSVNYIVHHNTRVDNLYVLQPWQPFSEPFRIAHLGTTRDVQINQSLLYSLGNHGAYELYFYGEGESNATLKAYAQRMAFANAFFTGPYDPVAEQTVYESCDFMNSLSGTGLNNQTTLPDRVYQAVVYAKPLIAIEGSYVADIVHEYEIGLVVPSINSLKRRIPQYVDEFDLLKYEKGRTRFFAQVLMENEQFKRNLGSFLGKIPQQIST